MIADNFALSKDPSRMLSCDYHSSDALTYDYCFIPFTNTG